MRNYLTLIIACGSFFLADAQQSAQKRTYTIEKADSLFVAQQWTAARTEYEGALSSEKNKGNALAWYRLGCAADNLNDHASAITYFNHSIDAKPSAILLPYVHARMARAYALTNDNAKSLEQLEKAVAAGYPDLNALERSPEFASFRDTEKFRQLVIQAGINAFPCRADAQSRQFDFWVGEWDVYATGTKFKVGNSLIEKASGDCMILENWTAIGMPNNGKSMNYVNPETGKWEQLWIGSGGKGNHVTRFYNGEYKDNVMRFEFEMKTPQGRQAGRFSFFNQGPDQVRQLSETSADGGKTWTTNYDFTYKRK